MKLLLESLKLCSLSRAELRLLEYPWFIAEGLRAEECTNMPRSLSAVWLKSASLACWVLEIFVSGSPFTIKEPRILVNSPYHRRRCLWHPECLKMKSTGPAPIISVSLRGGFWQRPGLRISLFWCFAHIIRQMESGKLVVWWTDYLLNGFLANYHRVFISWDCSRDINKIMHEKCLI